MAFPGRWFDQHDPRSLHKQNAQVAVAPLRYLAEDGAIPGRDLLRYKAQPSGKVAAFRERSPVPIAATIALEMIGPMPGTLTSRSQPASCRASAVISPDK